MNDVEPWTGEDPGATLASFRVTIETLRVTGICLQPFIPSAASRLLDALGVPKDKRTWADASDGAVGTVQNVKLF